jgi:hypothetical protein
MRIKIINSSELDAEYEERTCKVEDLKNTLAIEEIITFPGADMEQCLAAGSEFGTIIEKAMRAGGTNELCMMLPPIV